MTHFTSRNRNRSFFFFFFLLTGSSNPSKTIGEETLEGDAKVFVETFPNLHCSQSEVGVVLFFFLVLEAHSELKDLNHGYADEMLKGRSHFGCRACVNEGRRRKGMDSTAE